MRYGKFGLLRGLLGAAAALRGRQRWLFAGVSAVALAAVAAGTAFAVLRDAPTKRAGAKPLVSSEFGKPLPDSPLAGKGKSDSGEGDNNEGSLIVARDQYFTSKRIAGSTPLDVSQAGALRAQAALQAKRLGRQSSPSLSSQRLRCASNRTCPAADSGVYPNRSSSPRNPST